MNPETRTCQNCLNNFVIEPSDFVFYEKIGVPTPTLCPQCRYQRRMANRNEWNFFQRTCTFCGKPMISIYNPSYPGPVYCNTCWWSDAWDPMDFGRDFDFSRPFFEQFYEHRFSVPRLTLANSTSVNSEYTNQASDNKNCYMAVATNESEDCLYGNWYQGSKNCVDCWSMDKCELMYECLNCVKCYKCIFVDDSVDTVNTYFSKDCRGCSDCFGCAGLRNKSYCWFNEQLSKEEYLGRLEATDWSFEGTEGTKKKCADFFLTKPVKYYHGNQNVNSTGDYLLNNKNTTSSFSSRLCENLRYGQDAWEARDCMDLTETLDNELDYEMEGAGWGANCIASCKSWSNHCTYYCELNFNCNDIFGCLALQKKSYCIFNKQYSKEAFDKLRLKIIQHMKTTGEWGEFFPVAVSPFPYNDSLAQSYFPMTKEQVEAKGWRWYDRDIREYKVTLPHQKLPNLIEYAPDTILKEIISCSSQDSEEDKKKYLRCSTAFRLHPAELAFYRNMNLPIPHKCSACRLQDRLARRNPRQLWHHKCMKPGCPNEFETSYSPDRPEIVYCEPCYQNSVV